MVGIRLSTRGRDVKLVKLNECRYAYEFGIKMPMLYEDEVAERHIGSIGTIIEYDKQYNQYHVLFDSGVDIWLYRNEFIILMSNMLW